MNATPPEAYPSINAVWEGRYGDDPGYRNKYPFTSVVSFLFRHRPKDVSPAGVRVLEVGCGSGSNLWCAAREGFQVAGIDGSATVIEYARRWFERDGLTGDFRVGNYMKLPFEDGGFQLVIDRAALSYCGRAIDGAVAEISRVMAPGGRFLFSPYSDRCSSFDGLPDEDGCYRNITAGTCAPDIPVRFYGLNEVRELFGAGWEVLSLEHHEFTSFNKPYRSVLAQWELIARKI